MYRKQISQREQIGYGADVPLSIPHDIVHAYASSSNLLQEE